MSKTPPNRLLHDLLTHRWSPRAFSDRPIAPYTLTRLFEAARWAPSSFNEQPWRFIIARREEHDAFQQIVDCLTPANQVWARRAGALVMSAASLYFAKNGAANRHALYDVGQAVAQLTVQATGLGLFVHQMAGFDRARATAALRIPTGFEAVTAIAIGYLGDPSILPDGPRELETAPRTRRSLAELCFAGTWGAAAALPDSEPLSGC